MSAPTAASTNQAGRKRTRVAPREVKMEVTGTIGEPLYERRFDRMVMWRNRYIPLLRAFFTGVNTDALGRVFTRPQPDLSIDGRSVDLTSSSSSCGGAASGDAATEADRHGEQVDDFMRTQFFSEKFGISHLLLRPYFDEPTRTVSYLMADKRTKKAVILDPTMLFVNEYAADVVRFDLTVERVALTHVPFDVVTAVPLDIVPCQVGRTPILLSELEKAAAARGERDLLTDQELTIPLGPDLYLQGVPCANVIYAEEDAPTADDAATRDSAVCFLLRTTAPTSSSSPNTPPTADVTNVSNSTTTTLAAFTGMTLGTDCVARCDLRYVGTNAVDAMNNDRKGPLLRRATESETAANAKSLFASLRRLLAEFDPLTVIFPSHGGYNHMTNAMDLFWASHWADMQRNTANNTLLDALHANPTRRDGGDDTAPKTEGPFVAYAFKQRAEHLPVPILFQHTKTLNLKSITTTPTGGAGGATDGHCNAMLRLPTQRPRDAPSHPSPPAGMDVGCQSLLLPEGVDHNVQVLKSEAELMQALFPTSCRTHHNCDDGGKTGDSTTSSYVIGAVDTSAPLLLDLRDTADHCNRRVEPSLSIPFSFPATERDVKKAELWMQTLLHPEQSHVVICPKGRLRDCAWRFFRIGLFGGSNTTSAVRFVEEDVVPDRLWTYGRWSRVRSYKDMQPMDNVVTAGGGAPNLPHTGSDGKVTVVDCRTTYEFQNGSHVNCVHVPLADMRSVILDAATTTTAAPRSRTGDSSTRALFDAVVAKDGKIIVYCAGGYRSHLAVSLLRYVGVSEGCRQQQQQKAQPVAVTSDDCTPPPAATTTPISSDLVLCDHVIDLQGGALQLMTHRPDLWSTKDRSIICIS